MFLVGSGQTNVWSFWFLIFTMLLLRGFCSMLFMLEAPFLNYCFKISERVMPACNYKLVCWAGVGFFMNDWVCLGFFCFVWSDVNGFSWAIFMETSSLGTYLFLYVWTDPYLLYRTFYLKRSFDLSVRIAIISVILLVHSRLLYDKRLP